jgi:quercetin dioxygenase-like cupin family protein
MRLKLFAAVLALSLPFAAAALDASGTVKVTPLMKTTSSWDGKQIEYPAGQGEVTGLIVEVAPGGQTGWHEHPVPSFAYVLEGELEVTRASGEVKILKAGDTLAEVVNTVHNGRPLGDKPVKILVFYAGTKDGKLTIPHPEFRPAGK